MAHGAKAAWGFMDSVKVGIAVVIYWLSVSAVPIANKISMSLSSKQDSDFRKFPYPLATAFLQLSFVSAALALGSIVGHYCCRCTSGDSWLLGPHFGFKLRKVFATGFCFGLKYGITNWGLQLLPTGTHLLLQATDLVWTLLMARVLLNERPGDLETVSALMVTAGTVLVGIQSGQTVQAPFLALAVNLITPVLLALCVVTLRHATVELQRKDNILQGRVSPMEITALKLAISALVSLVLSLCLENGQVQLSAGDAEFHQHPPWWDRLGEEGFCDILVIVLGGVFVLIFQVNLTWLISMTSAVTVGIVGSVKVVPQWFSSAAAQGQVDMAPLNLMGVALVLGASIMYTVVADHQTEQLKQRQVASMPRKLVIGPKGCQWEPREVAKTDELRAFLAMTSEGP